jgi:hypothetical protein
MTEFGWTFSLIQSGSPVTMADMQTFTDIGEGDMFYICCALLTTTDLKQLYQTSKQCRLKTSSQLFARVCILATDVLLSVTFNTDLDPMADFVKWLLIEKPSDLSALKLTRNVTRLTFGQHFNEPLGVLPAGVTQLKFGSRFNQPLAVGVLPAGVTHLTFGCNFNQPLTAGVLPAGVTLLTFGSRYGRYTRMSDFNQPLTKGVLPGSVRKLTFGCDFNQPLAEGVLPAGVTQLMFGHCFNQPLAEGVLPAGVTQLTFGFEFNQPLAAGVLPAGMTLLTFVSIGMV